MLRWLLAPLGRTARWVLAAAALIRGLVLFAGASTLDRAFVVDDAYYTLSVARTLAQN
jgi:hypothetical protein